MILHNLTKVSSEYFNFECKLMDGLTNRDIICPALQAHCLQIGKLNTVIYKIMTRLLFFLLFLFLIEKKKKENTINCKISTYGYSRLNKTEIPVILSSKYPVHNNKFSDNRNMF